MFCGLLYFAAIAWWGINCAAVMIVSRIVYIGLPDTLAWPKLCASRAVFTLNAQEFAHIYIQIFRPRLNCLYSSHTA